MTLKVSQGHRNRHNFWGSNHTKINSGRASPRTSTMRYSAWQFLLASHS